MMFILGSCFKLKSYIVVWTCFGWHARLSTFAYFLCIAYFFPARCFLKKVFQENLFYFYMKHCKNKFRWEENSMYIKIYT